MKEFIQKGEIPFVRVLVPLILGISAGLHLPLTSPWYNILLSLLVGLFLSLILYQVLYRKFKLYNRRWISGILLSAFIGVLGLLITVRASQKIDQKHFSKTRQEFLIAVITSEPKVSGDIIRFETKIKQRIEGNQSFLSTGNLLVALKASSQSEEYRYGDLLIMPNNYNEVEPPFNPNEFDFKTYLGNKAIYHQVFVNDKQLKILKRDQGNPVMTYAIGLRQKLVERFNKYITDKDATAVASTLILGYRADLSKEVLNAYSATGTMHVLSVSGMHVGIVFFVLTFLLKRMDRTQKLRLIKAGTILLLIWAYACITGFSAAVCRAALMLSFVIIGKAINKNQNTYNLVAISAVILLIYNPFFLVDVGFQLSYLAVLGLVYLYPKIYHLLYTKNYILDKIWSYSALSIATQLATFPLSLYYFHQFPLSFLVSNLFIVLPVTVIMYLGLLFVIVPVDFISEPLGWLLNKLIAFSNYGLYYLEHLPYSVIRGIWINHWEYVLLYVLIILFIYYISYKNSLILKVSLALIMILIAGSSFKILIKQSECKVIFYSLRKKLAIGFVEGRKAFLLTNLKEGDKTYSFSVQPFINAELINKEYILNVETNLDTGNIYKDKNFIQFRNWKMVIWNKQFNFKRYKTKLAVDAVLLSDNPYITLEMLLKYVAFKQVIIDGTNSDYRISRWIKEAEERHLSYYVIKKNPAYIINL